MARWGPKRVQRSRCTICIEVHMWMAAQHVLSFQWLAVHSPRASFAASRAIVLVLMPAAACQRLHLEAQRTAAWSHAMRSV